jgi:hypothetical protein
LRLDQLLQGKSGFNRHQIAHKTNNFFFPAALLQPR